ncbi:MAG: (2Fe-2S)-binding protein [Bacillota bacterium]
MTERINSHPILGSREEQEKITIIYDGQELTAEKGEMIVAALYANGIRINRYTIKNKEPRGIFCGIGQCTDCAMVVNGQPNVRTCVTPVEEGMVIATQCGASEGGGKHE